MSAREKGSTLERLSAEMADTVAEVGEGVVAIHGRRRIPSTGVHRGDGVVVTASHTVEQEGDLDVVLPGGARVSGRVTGRDPGTDLAIVRIPADGLATPAWAGPEGLAVGRLVLALGRPWDAGVTASLGVVSAVGGEWRTWSGGVVDRLVRLDLTIHDGFSGGPLVAAGGGVLGINTSGLLRRAALTVPGATVERVVAHLLEHGHVRRGYLGVAMQRVRLNPAAREAAGVDGKGGLLIANVEPDGPADRGGLLLGDVLLELGGRRVRDVRDVAAVLGSLEVGAATEAAVLRGGERRTVSIEVGLYPHAEAR